MPSPISRHAGNGRENEWPGRTKTDGKVRIKRTIKQGLQNRLGHAAALATPTAVAAMSLAVEGCWGVAMGTPLCFPFSNYLAAGCQLDTSDTFRLCWTRSSRKCLYTTANSRSTARTRTGSQSFGHSWYPSLSIDCPRCSRIDCVFSQYGYAPSKRYPRWFVRIRCIRSSWNPRISNRKRATRRWFKRAKRRWKPVTAQAVVLRNVKFEIALDARHIASQSIGDHKGIRAIGLYPSIGIPTSSERPREWDQGFGCLYYTRPSARAKCSLIPNSIHHPRTLSREYLFLPFRKPRAIPDCC